MCVVLDGGRQWFCIHWVTAVGGSEAYKGWPRRKRDKLISHEDRKLGFTREGLISVPETLTQ